MRSYLSFVVVLAGMLSVSCADVEMFRDDNKLYAEAVSADLTSTQVLNELAANRMPIAKQVELMSRVKDRDAFVCNGRSFDKLLELNDASDDKCFKESLVGHNELCKSLVEVSNQACINVRYYCRNFLERIAGLCIDRMINSDSLPTTEAKSEFSQDLSWAIRDNGPNYAHEFRLMHAFANKKTILEKFLDDQSDKQPEVQHFDQAPFQMQPGRVMNELLPNNYICSLVKMFEPTLNQMYGGKLASVEPLAYRDQIVAGTMHFIRVKLTAVDGSQGIIHLNIWDRPNESAKLHAIRVRVDQSAPLTRFDQNDF